MILSSRKLVAGVFAVGAVAAVIVACGSDGDSKFKDPGITPGFFPDSGFGPDSGDDPNGDLFRLDPPPAFCGPETGLPQPAAPGGTADCPDDKNKPNCGCATEGEEADCWTGLRKNRKLGLCKDGRTKCVKKTENENVWGPCLGQVLPKENATGEVACSCFSVGLWKIANTAPCIWSDGAGFYAYSSQLKKDAAGNTYAGHCGEGNDPSKPSGPGNPALFVPRGQKPPETWSTDTLTTDCAGTFTLVFRVRVGDFNNPKATDCILGESEVFADYREENKEQVLPNLPHWTSTNTECATQWEKGKPGTESPGYGEMIVKGGQTVRCENVAPVGSPDKEFVFNRIQFCGRDCRNDANGNPPTAEACKQCALNGEGDF